MHSTQNITYYNTLGVMRNASYDEIKKAFRRLAKETHPDKVSDREDEFIEIQTAYEVLSDSNKRAVYDQCLDQGIEYTPGATVKTFPSRRPYRLGLDPHRHNHYAYINLLFGVDETSEEYLVPGQAISAWDQNRLYWQLHYISGPLHAKRKKLLQKKEKSAGDRERIEVLESNERKMGQIVRALTCGEKNKLLYDLSLGPDVVQPTDEMREIEELIGGQAGRERLAEHIRAHYGITISGSVFALKETGCLNPANFEEIISTTFGEYDFSDMSSMARILQKNNILNQENFDLLMRNKEHILSIRRGASCINARDLFNQSSFEELIESGKGANALGSALKTLHDYKVLNAANRQMVIGLAKKTDIGSRLIQCFRSMDENERLIEENSDLSWNGDEALQPLSMRIDEMFAYGIYLLGEDRDDNTRAKAAMLLALELKSKLKTFYERPQEEQLQLGEQFKTEFMQLLHSRDGIMGQHRARWKIIVANIAIGFMAALTGIGLLVLGAYYAYSGQCLFGQTKREKLRDAINEEALRVEVPRLLH